MAKEVRHVEDEPGITDQEHGNTERILQRRIGREGNGVGLALHFDAGRIGLAGDVQRPDMQDNDARNHERQQIVKRKEAVQRRLIHGKAAEQELLDPFADGRKRREEAGDDGRAPEGHLTPGQNIAHEARRHHQQEDDAAKNPEDFTRRLVGAVIEATGDVQVNRDKEERRAVGMHVAQQPAVVDVAHDLFDGIEGNRRFGRIMHGQHDAGKDLHDQHDGEHRAESVGVVQITRDRIGNEAVIDHARQGKPRIDPPLDAGGRLITGMTTHEYLSPYPILITVSDVNANVGMARFCGAGPLRMRPAVS